MKVDFEIPPEAKALYVQRRGKDLEKLKISFSNHSTGEFKRIGHDLKGNAVTFGFPDLENLGKSLETIASSQDWKLAQTLIELLETWYAHETESSARPLNSL